MGTFNGRRRGWSAQSLIAKLPEQAGSANSLLPRAVMAEGWKGARPWPGDCPASRAEGARPARRPRPNRRGGTLPAGRNLTGSDPAASAGACSCRWWRARRRQRSSSHARWCGTGSSPSASPSARPRAPRGLSASPPAWARREEPAAPPTLRPRAQGRSELVAVGRQTARCRGRRGRSRRRTGAKVHPRSHWTPHLPPIAATASGRTRRPPRCPAIDERRAGGCTYQWRFGVQVAAFGRRRPSATSGTAAIPAKSLAVAMNRTSDRSTGVLDVGIAEVRVLHGVLKQRRRRGVAEARRGSGLRTLASRNPLTIQPGARARAAAGGERQPRDHAEARGRLTNRHLPTPRHPTGRSLARPRRPAVRPRRSGCCAARSCPRGRRTRTAADRSSPWVTGSSRAGPRCWDR